MNWIKNMYRWLFGKKNPSNVILSDNQGNGMTFDQAKNNARNLGNKVKWIEWAADHYFYWDGQYFMEHILFTPSTLDREFDLVKAERLIGCGWTECGKMYLTTKAE